LATAAAKPVGFKFVADRPLKVTIHAFPPINWSRGDDDNLIASAKSFLDGIAAALRVDDDCFAIQPVDWSDKSKAGRLVIEVEGPMA